MLKNYLTVALRNLLRNKVYSLINILGLSIGMVCCILAIIVIRHELGYDRFHTQGDRIYRILRERVGAANRQVRWLTSGALARAVEADFPEISRASKCRIYPVKIRQGNRVFDQQLQGQIDENFFEVFDFPFVKGNPETALSQPYSAVITEEMAARLFGREDPIGKVLTIVERYYGGDYTITGILKDIPAASSIQFDLLHATDGRTDEAKIDWTAWQGRVQQAGIETFVLLAPGHSVQELERKLPEFLERHMGKEVRSNITYRLQPLLRMRLFARSDYGLIEGGDIRSLYLFADVALIILTIACINFVNLATARSAGRAREVGLRKVVGAHRGQLIRQFLCESLLLALFAFLLALLLADLVLPRFNALAEGQFTLTWGALLRLLPLLLVAVLGVGLAAGIYPAFYLSRFEPAGVLKGSLTGSGRSRFRQTLVVFQFAISILLIIWTTVVYRQLEYIQSKQLGFDREHFIILPLFLLDRENKTNQDPWLAARYNVVKQAFLESPNVLSATAFRFLPGQSGGFVRIVKPEGHEATEWRMPVQEADESFPEAFQIELLAGRTFSPRIERDRTYAYILNETAVKALGWTVEDAVGRRFGRARSEEDAKGTVIGVVKDFHYTSLRKKIEPAAIAYRQWFYNFLGLRVRGENIPSTLAFLEQKWTTFMPPDLPFTFSFLNDEIDAAYRSEKRLGQIVSAFSTLAIFLACLGLFGLATFSAETRTREIGVRKVLGASVSGIVLLLSKEFLKLVIVANLIAWPFAYYAMTLWLQNFAYRVDLHLWIFLLGGLITFGVALATVGYQAVKAATANPVDAIRYE